MIRSAERQRHLLLRSLRRINKKASERVFIDEGVIASRPEFTLRRRIKKWA